MEWLINVLTEEEVERAKRFIAESVTDYFRNDEYIDSNVEGIRQHVEDKVNCELDDDCKGSSSEGESETEDETKTESEETESEPETPSEPESESEPETETEVLSSESEVLSSESEESQAPVTRSYTAYT